MNPYPDQDRLYFLFDFISHNAYLAWTQLPALAKRHGLALTPVPVLFAGYLDHFGQKGPAEMPAKSRWMLWNVLRKAKLHGIPFAPPASHPFLPLLPLRACCTDLTDAQRVQLVDRLYRMVWAESRPLQEPAVVAEAIRDCGLDADALLAAAATDAVKARLRSNTQESIGAGVFGVPTMIVRGELFWGFDDLPFLQAFLEGAEPLGDRAAYADWFRIKPSIMRKAAAKP